MPAGGIIPPDNRQPAPKGVGKQARRHDLEKPKGSVPGLKGSSLQYGDVSMLKDAQKIAPTGSNTKQIQQPARGGQPANQSTTPQQAAGMSVPDPMDFMASRLQNTRKGSPSSQKIRAIDPAPFLPLLRRLANAPGSSGTLQNAVVSQMANMVKRPYVPAIRLGDMQDLDAGVEAMVDALNRQ